MKRLSRWWAKYKADAEENEKILSDNPGLKKMLDHFQMFQMAAFFIFIVFLMSGDDEIPDFIAVPVLILWTIGLAGKFILGSTLNYFRENKMIIRK